MRLDALDHRGQWYAGSVAELWKVRIRPDRNLRADWLPPLLPSLTVSLQVSGKDLDSLRQQYTMTGKGSGGMPAEAGLHIR